MKYFYAHYVLACRVCGHDFYDGDQFYLVTSGKRGFSSKQQTYCKEHAPDGAELTTLQLSEPTFKTIKKI